MSSFNFRSHTLTESVSSSSSSSYFFFFIFFFLLLALPSSSSSSRPVPLRFSFLCGPSYGFGLNQTSRKMFKSLFQCRLTIFRWRFNKERQFKKKRRFKEKGRLKKKKTIQVGSKCEKKGMALVSVLKELQRGPASRSSPADESYNRNGGFGMERSGVGLERIVCGGADALRAAASAGDFERVKELCKKSVAIDADSEGRTALHYSSLNGHLQIVKEIINAAAKVNVKDVVRILFSILSLINFLHLLFSPIFFSLYTKV